MSKLNICYVPNLGNRRKGSTLPWGAEFFAEAFKKHSQHYVTVETTLDNIDQYDLVWVHNVANLLKGLRGRLGLASKRLTKKNRWIGGVRGSIGYESAKDYLKFFDALHTSNDQLTELCKQHRQNTETIISGVPEPWFTQTTPPKGFTIGWAGDKTKDMKNVSLLYELGESLLIQSKENYIPNNLMPAHFYHRINLLVHPSSHEGSCRVITEAAACGLPIICTEAGHNRELVGPEWIFNLDDSDVVESIKNRVQHFKDNPVDAVMVGEGNQDRARAYMWGNVIGRCDGLISSVVDVE